MRNRTLIALLPGLVALAILSQSAPAEARYRGYGGYIPHHPPPLAFKWRTHAYIGVEGNGFVVLSQQIDNVGPLGHGGGLGLYGGVRLGRWVSVEANWHFTVHTEYYSEDDEHIQWHTNSHQLHTITGDIKLHIPTWTRAEPFIQAGGGVALFGLTHESAPDGFTPLAERAYLYKQGPMFQVGGGFSWWASQYINIGARVLYQGIFLGKSRYDLIATDTSKTTPAEQHSEHASASSFINGLSFAASASFHF